LVAVPEIDNGEEVTRYFVEPANSARPLTEDDLAKVRSLAGAWSDVDWEETLASLEEIRQSSKPSPPLEDM
jgi:uncharacterized protein with NRDE domain